MSTNLQVGVKIFLKNIEGKFLLLRRSSEKYNDKSLSFMWDLVGGRIDPGTGLMENLKREIKEETQLKFEGEAKLLAAQDILRWSEKHIVRLTYIGKIAGDPILSDEHVEYKWFSFEELKTLEGLDPYVFELLKGNVPHETFFSS